MGHGHVLDTPTSQAVPFPLGEPPKDAMRPVSSIRPYLGPRSRGQDKPCDFCVRSGTFSRLGVQDTQKCPLENRNVAALMLTMPGRVAGDHPFLPRFAAILLQVVSPPVKVGWDTALSAGKIPHVHLVPLNVSQGSIGSLLLFAQLCVGVLVAFARLPRRDVNVLTTVIRFHA